MNKLIHKLYLKIKKTDFKKNLKNSKWNLLIKETFNKNHTKLNNTIDQLNLSSLILNAKAKILDSNNNLKEKIEIFNPTKIIPKLQDNIANLIRNDDNQVLLKQSQHWAKTITWILIGGTTAGIAWISIAKTDEIVIATGRLEPKGGVIDVQMPLEGIAREILISEGEKVVKGQVLIHLDTEITEATNRALQNRLLLSKSIKEKLELLVKEGAVSELQYLEQKSQIEDLKSQIQTNQVKLRYQKITSPSDGIVFDLKPKGPGYVARTSEPVLKIVPTKNLVAKVEIDNRTIGFVTVGKPADISIDSFPASDFGVIEGTVTKIGSDALPPIASQGKGYRFPADVTLKNQYLEIKTGQKLPLQAGMSLSANIKLRKATYLQLLLSKFVDKLASLKSI